MIVLNKVFKTPSSNLLYFVHSSDCIVFGSYLQSIVLVIIVKETILFLSYKGDRLMIGFHSMDGLLKPLRQ